MGTSFFDELERRNVFRVGTIYLVVAWLAIQVVETVFPAFGFDDAALRIVTIAFAIGLIPALILAWVFEITPDGLKKEKDVDRSLPTVPQTGERLDRAIIIMLLLAVGYLTADKFILSPQRQAARQQVTEEQLVSVADAAREKGRDEARLEPYGKKSIAVLPFVDMSAAQDQAYMSDGIAEELLNLLAKIPGLRVISRTSAFSFKGKDIKLSDVARELEVSHILEGSVRTAGGQVRITAQLIDARTDSHIWSETYNRKLEDIFAIQDEIGATVVSALKLSLLSEAPKVMEPDPRAYSLFLQARHFSRQTTEVDNARSIELFQQALAIDPQYAAAWNGLADSYIDQTAYGDVPVGQDYSLARAMAIKALTIDPDLASAHASLGMIEMLDNLDLAAAAGHYKLALALDSANTDILGDAAWLLHSLGRPQEAVLLDEYRVAHDPLNPGGHYNLASDYLSAGRWDEAVESFGNALLLSPDTFGANYNIGVAYLLMGDPSAALKAMQREPHEAFRDLGMVMARYALGQYDQSDSLLQNVIEKHEKSSAFNIAYVLAYLGQTDRAFKWLDKARQYGDSGLSEIVGEPLFANIEGDPRWQVFLQGIGSAAAQLDAVEFEVSLPQ